MEILEKIVGAAKECGKVLLEVSRDPKMITSKEGRANFVTQYDVMIEKMLKEKLSKILPEAEFMGEEEEFAGNIGAKYLFIVDPIDGTTNFIKDYHMSCISIGLLKEGEKYLGVVYNPYLDEVFSAVKGEGAFLNGEKISVTAEPMSNAIALFGTSPYNVELGKESFKKAYECFTKCLDIRRSGSAALDLCAVACGRAELFFELILSPWDYAAGALIVEEAGGKVTTLTGEKLPLGYKTPVLARNSKIEISDIFDN